MTLCAILPKPSLRRLLPVLLLACLAWASPSVGSTRARDGAIQAQVSAPGGRPLVGARIELQALPTPWQRAVAQGREDYAPRVVAEARARAGGRFRLVLPEPGAWRVVIRHPEHLPMAYPLGLWGGGVELPPIELTPRQEMRVRLADPEGRALAGVRILVSDSEAQPASGWHGDVRRTTTDADGVALIPFAPGESLLLGAWHRGQVLYRRLEPEPFEGAGGAISTLALAPTDQSVRLLHADGRGASGVAVALARPFLALAQSDTEGRVLLPAGLDPAKDLLFLDPAGRFATPESRDIGPDGSAEWVLGAGSLLAGRVIDAHDDRSLAGVWLSSSGGHVRSNAEGLFRLRSPEKAPRLALAAEGYLERRVGIPARRAAEPLELALTAALELAGRVVDPGGQPLPGVRLELEPEPLGWSTGEWVPQDQETSEGGHPQWTPRRLSPSADRKARTHRDGGFRFAPVAPDVAYRLKIEHVGFAPLERMIGPLRRGDDPRPLDIVLSPGLRLTGTVVDPDGRAVRGAGVALRPGDGATEVDATGRFVIRDLAPGMVHLAVTAQGFAPTGLPAIELRPGQPALDLGELVLEPESTLPGRVVDPDGRPVAGARVWARRSGGVALAASEHEVESDAEGRFEILGLDAGARLHLRVRHPDFQEVKLHGRLGAGGRPLELTLHPGIRVHGRVLRSDGSPVAEAKVTAGPSAERLGGVGEVATDADGRFELTPQAPGKIVLRAIARQGRSRPRELTLNPGDTPPEVVLELDASAVVGGRIVGPEGRGVAGARVVGGGMHATHSDADGHFRLAGLAQDRLVLGVDHPEYEPVRQAVAVGEEVEIELASWRGRRTVSGWVLGPSGQGVGGAEVRLLDASLGPGQVARSSTRHDGSFALEAPAEGRYLVEVAHPGFAPRRGSLFRLADDDVTDLTLELAHGATIWGQVAGLAAETLRGASILAFAPEHGGRPGHLLGQGYSIPNLPSGTWRVSLHLGTGQQAATGMVSVGPGEERRLDLRL